MAEENKTGEGSGALDSQGGERIDRPTSGDTPTAPVSLQISFSGQQTALLSALEKRDKALAVMYRGGLFVLADTSNPDRHSLCAHAIRELMEKLPEYLDVSTKAHQESLKAKVREIEDYHAEMQKRTTCLSATVGWNGPIDSHLRTFLGRLAKFLEWFANHYPRRREETHTTLIRLDASGRQLPPPLAEFNVDIWEATRDYFIAVAHHGKVAVSAEFRQWLEALERFLLDRLMPRTFDDFAEIDMVIREEDEDA